MTLNISIGFYGFWRFGAARHISRANYAEITIETNQDNLRMKFSALNSQIPTL